MNESYIYIYFEYIWKMYSKLRFIHESRQIAFTLRMYVYMTNSSIVSELKDSSKHQQFKCNASLKLLSSTGFCCGIIIVLFYAVLSPKRTHSSDPIRKVNNANALRPHIPSTSFDSGRNMCSPRLCD